MESLGCMIFKRMLPVAVTETSIHKCVFLGRSKVPLPTRKFWNGSPAIFRKMNLLQPFFHLMVSTHRK